MFLPFNEKELAALVEKNQYYFLKAYESVKNGRIKFNWGAFLFGPLWLLYRKAYIFALPFFIVYFVSSGPKIVEYTTTVTLSDHASTITRSGTKIFFSPFILIQMLVLGLVANFIYFYFLKTEYQRGVRHVGINLYAPVIGAILLFGRYLFK